MSVMVDHARDGSGKRSTLAQVDDLGSVFVCNEGSWWLNVVLLLHVMTIFGQNWRALVVNTCVRQ